MSASVDGVDLKLSSSPFEILLLLATRTGDSVHRQEIAERLRQGRGDGSRSIDMHISRIRRRLREAGEDGLNIHTIFGRGYSLTYRDATVGGPARESRLTSA